MEISCLDLWKLESKTEKRRKAYDVIRIQKKSSGGLPLPQVS